MKKPRKYLTIDEVKDFYSSITEEERSEISKFITTRIHSGQPIEEALHYALNNISFRAIKDSIYAPISIKEKIWNLLEITP